MVIKGPSPELTFKGQNEGQSIRPKEARKAKRAVSVSPKNIIPSKWPAAGLLGLDLVPAKISECEEICLWNYECRHLSQFLQGMPWHKKLLPCFSQLSRKSCRPQSQWSRLKWLFGHWCLQWSRQNFPAGQDPHLLLYHNHRPTSRPPRGSACINNQMCSMCPYIHTNV